MVARCLLIPAGVRVPALCLALAAAACGAEQPVSGPEGAAAAGGRPDLFRDFLGDGKYDEAGHPLNARVTEAEALCTSAGRIVEGGFAIEGRGLACEGALGGSEQRGSLVANLRLLASGFSRGEVLRVEILAGDRVLASARLLGSQIRQAGAWMNLPVAFEQGGATPVTVRVRAAGNGRVVLDYVELFPRRFGLVLGPGSGELGDDDEITIETDAGADVAAVQGNDVDLAPRLAELRRSGQAREEATQFRRLVHVRVSDLLAGLPGTVELRVRAGGHAARLQVRRGAPECRFEGDPDGVRVLVTGFHPFPADGWHDNVSAVAVTAMSPEAMPGVQLMRMVMPVEYDRAAAQVVSAIRRCAPEVVVSFGQGGGDLELETTAYNLKDTSEVAGGVPDNRGVIAAAVPIEEDGEPERSTLLPLERIAEALRAAGERPALSDDPGRYICNNVFYAEARAAAEQGAIAGFVHLPYTTHFSDDVRARWGRALEVIVGAAAASRRM